MNCNQATFPDSWDDVTINHINKAMAALNLLARINPLVQVGTSQAALITQVGASSVNITNGSGQATIGGITIDANILAGAAKINGVIIALGRAAQIGITGAAGLTGWGVFAPTIGLSILAGAVAMLANKTFREIISDANFWKSMEGGIGGIDKYLKEKYGLDLNHLASKVFEAMLSGHIEENSLECDSKQSNSRFQEAVTFAPRDPLALDLDNDGIETVAINPTAPILFDHNGDGASSATGWLKGDDGWLVNDLDQDGLITSGKELLGVDTDITVGGVTRKATTGFEALRALDSHQVDDGKNLFDSRDAAFSQLLVWQDKNQNGMTDAGELSTLSALGIVSIQLQETTTNVDLGGGNSITGKALVTRRVGTSTSTSEVDSVLVTNDSAANLNLADNPFYTDLRDVPLTDTARSLPNMQGSGLVHSLREAMSLGNAASNALTATVQAFAAATTRDAQMALLGKLITEWGATSNLVTSGTPATGTWLATSVAPNSALSATTQQRIKTFAEQNPEMYRKVIVLEQFNGQMGLSTLMNRWNVTLPPAVTNLLNDAYSTLQESVYGALTIQTRLKPYLDAINISVDDQGLRFDLTELSALIANKQSTDISKAITDVLELSQFAGDTLFEIGFDSTSTMRSLLSSAPSNLPLLSQLPTLGLFQAGATTGTRRNDMYLGDQGNNSFKAGDGSDFLSGDAGVDNLYGEAGNDTLDGGSGNDSLRGGAGADVYAFGKGDGSDTINNDDSDALGTSADAIRFKMGVSPADAALSRSGSDLLIRINGTTDSLTVTNYFNADATAGYAIEALRFAEGSEWDIPTVKSKVLQSTAGSDTLTGYTSNDNISGGAGNDTLYGEAGDDTLDGGSGNDLLFGREGADTYLFGKGDGQDTINAPDAYGQGAIADRILFKADVSPADVSLKRSGDDLLISINGTANSLLVDFYFGFDVTSGSALESLRFADGTTWGIPTVKAKALQSTAGNDTLTGYTSPDSISGGAGNDTLHGEAGNDTLDGGSGNDYLRGGSDSYWDNDTGKDVYLFGRGSGQDTISNGSDEAAGSSPDAIFLGAGIAPADLALSHSGDDLIIRINGTSDSLLVTRYFESNGTTSGVIESIKFAEGTVWNYANVKAKAMLPTTGDDRLHGYATNDTINSGAGNDTVYGYAGNDVLEGSTGIDNLYGGEDNDSLHGNDHDDNLHGDAGADTLKGGAGMDGLYGGNGNDSLQGDEDNDYLRGQDGNDTLNGGSGNDALRGDQGADVYLFGKGAGQDTIYNEDTDAVGTNYDTILLGTGIDTADIRLAKSIDDLIVNIIGTSDSLVVKDYFDDDGTSKHVVETLKFSSGTTWDVKTVLNKFTISTDGADVLYGTPDTNVIDGKAGNDTIYAGLGSDTYMFGKGDGRDVITSSDDPAVGKIDTLLFKPSVAPSEVTFGTAPNPFYSYQLGGGEALVIKITGSTDQVIIEDFLYNGDPANTRNPLQQIKFDDGTTWGIQTILSKLYAGTNSADIIDGTSKGELIKGGAGNDSLYGNNGRDTLDGGAGNDYIYEGSEDGNDTFLFGKGDGRDTISGSRDNDPGEVNTLLFKAGVAPSEVTLGTYYSDLIIKLANSTDQIVAENFHYDAYPNNGYAFQQIKFADGTTWNTAAILSKLYAGTESADRLDGTSYDEAINGQSGDDSLFGGNGRDTLAGGVGNDYINGGSGSDTYIFGIGDGQDTITETHGDVTSAKIDTLSFKPGIMPSDVVLNTAGTALIIKFAGTSDQITVREFFYQNTPTSKINPLQQIKFADGTVWNTAAIVSRLPSGNLVQGTPNDDGISGLAGNDSLYGNDGNDSLHGEAGDDQLLGGNGNDFLDGGAGIDWMSGGHGQDVYHVDDARDIVTEAETPDYDRVVASVTYSLSENVEDLELSHGATAAINATGNNLNNNISGNEFNNILSGGAGDDHLWGDAGHDTLKGGLGNDHLYVDSAGDVIEEDAGGGIDTVHIFGLTANTYTLRDNVENVEVFEMTPLDAAVVTIKGNTLNNAIFAGDNNFLLQGEGGDDELFGSGGNDALQGGQGDDILNGGQGKDSLFGGVGNDYYYVSGTEGLITEYAGEGVDTVTLFGLKANAYKMAEHLENLEVFEIEPLAGSEFAITGNAQNNSIYTGGTSSQRFRLSGGEGQDSLFGGLGQDTLEGGTGDDLLYGDAGSDAYLFRRGHGQDSITDFDSSVGNTDRLTFEGAITHDQLWFSQAGSNLKISVIGTTDSVTISNWSSGAAHQVEQITAGGKSLSHTQVSNLVQAMAGMAAPAANQTSLSDAQRTQLAPVLAASWG